MRDSARADLFIEAFGITLLQTQIDSLKYVYISMIYSSLVL